ncbi:uncharacterized protein LOC135711340 [Ochlerotatus camptorhynchus]|uniref:uncharacterized protein LOC135711340 n=1 Tax=Ochlerotatus camptorhynchus TaxID=644619 RepID=UPI0031DD86BE
MDKCNIIDLCDVKSEKSVDTSTTIPLDENANTTSNMFEDESFAKQDLTEQWIREQNATILSFNDNLKHEGQSINIKTCGSSNLMDIAVMIPTEITELVNKECAIKLINYLVIYAINKVTEADLHRKLLSVTPDIDPQINYRSNIGFQCVYERCVVLFYEALLDLTEILQQFESSLQNIVVLWMYNTVENICKAHAIDGTFLRNDKYIEALLRDFMASQKDVPEQGNIFFNIYQKLQPTMVAAPSVQNQVPTAAGASTKKPRKPRTKKLGKITVTST